MMITVLHPPMYLLQLWLLEGGGGYQAMMVTMDWVAGQIMMILLMWARQLRLQVASPTPFWKQVARAAGKLLLERCWAC